VQCLHRPIPVLVELAGEIARLISELDRTVEPAGAAVENEALARGPGVLRADVRLKGPRDDGEGHERAGHVGAHWRRRGEGAPGRGIDEEV